MAGIKHFHVHTRPAVRDGKWASHRLVTPMRLPFGGIIAQLQRDGVNILPLLPSKVVNDRRNQVCIEIQKPSRSMNKARVVVEDVRKDP